MIIFIIVVIIGLQTLFGYLENKILGAIKYRNSSL